MRTTLNLPESLLRKAQNILHAKTKTETIVMGLRQILRREKIDGLLAMRGRRPLSVNISKSRKRD
jgi:hypothetical protein